MTPLPAFFFRKVLPDDPGVLAEGEGFLVYRRYGLNIIDWLGPWRSEFEEVYLSHDVKGVCINQTISWKGCSLDFLKRLLDLRSLHLGIDVPMDLTVLGELEGLETLGLTWRVPGASSPGVIDFQRLSRLKECLISWHPNFAAVLKLKTLRYLFLFDAPRLKGLDLTALPRLAELALDSCPALTQIDLSQEAKLFALELTNCGKFQPIWPRLAPDLLYLCLHGRIGFELDEIAAANNLRFLWIVLSGRQSWDVLRDLPHLEGIRVDGLNPSKELVALARSINEANGHGVTLGGRPSKLTLPDE